MNLFNVIDKDDEKFIADVFDEKVKEIFPNAIVKKSIEKDFNDDLLAKKWKRNPEIKQPEIQKPVEKIQKPKLAFGKKQNKGLSL